MVQGAFNLLAWTQLVIQDLKIRGANSQISLNELPDLFSLRILKLRAKGLRDVQGDRHTLFGNFNLLDGS